MLYVYSAIHTCCSLFIVRPFSLWPYVCLYVTNKLLNHPIDPVAVFMSYQRYHNTCFWFVNNSLINIHNWETTCPSFKVI